jgi:hypothetical protein
MGSKRKITKDSAPQLRRRSLESDTLSAGGRLTLAFFIDTEVVEGCNRTVFGPQTGFTGGCKGVVDRCKQFPVAEKHVKSRTPENDPCDVPLVRAQVVRYARNTWLGALHRNRPMLTVLNVKQLDVFFIHAELQQVVVARVLISPDHPHRFYPPFRGSNFEFDAQIAVTAYDFVVNRQRKFGFHHGRRDPDQYFGPAGRGIVKPNLPSWQRCPVGRQCPWLDAVEIDCGASEAKEAESDIRRGDTRYQTPV